MKYVEMASAQYMEPMLKEEKKCIRRARNAKAIQDVMTFLVGLVAMYVGVTIVQHISVWGPHVRQFLVSTGLF